MATEKTELRQALKETQEHLAEWRDNARLAHRYYASDQWREIDKRRLQASFRPAPTVNMVKKLVDVVSGNDITNRWMIKYLPRTVESQGVSDDVTDIVRAFKQQARAEFEETAAFRDQLISGVGALEYHEGMNGDLMISRVPYSEIAWDPGAIKANYEDAEWVLRGRWIPVRQFREMFPDAPKDILVSQMPSAPPFDAPSNESRGVHEPFTPFSSAQPRKSFDARRNLVLLFEMQKKTHETFLEVTDPQSGQTIPMSQEEFEQLARALSVQDMPIPPAETKMRRVIERSFWAGQEKLEDETIQNSQPSYFFLTGFEDMDDRMVTHNGLIFHLKDAQDIVNKGLSKMLHILQTTPNNLVVAETGVFEDPKTAQRIIATTGGLLEATIGSVTGGRIDRWEGRYPQNFERLVGMFTQFFAEISGINPFALGDVQDLRRVASSAVAQIQQQAMTILSVLFDSLRKYRILSGEWMLDYIREEVPEGRIFNVLTPHGGSRPINFNREAIRRGQFDVVVAEAPTSPSQMIEFWDTLTRSGGLDLLLQMGIFSPVEIVEIMPHIPQDLRDRITQRLTQPQQQPGQLPGGAAPGQQPIPGLQ